MRATYTYSVVLENGWRRVYELDPPLPREIPDGLRIVTFIIVSAVKTAPGYVQIIPFAAFDGTAVLRVFLPLAEPSMHKESELDAAMVDAVRRLGYEVIP